MRVLVCGGRDYSDRAKVFSTLDALQDETNVDAIIHGAAKGADSLAAEWVVRTFAAACETNKRFQCSLVPFPPDWKTHGKAAGPIRNQRMLDEGKPDLVIAFPGVKGTADMVRRAKEAGVRVLMVSASTA